MINKLNKICEKIIKNLDLKDVGFSGDFNKSVTLHSANEEAFVLNEPNSSYRLTENISNIDRNMVIRAAIPYAITLKNKDYVTFYITCLMNAMLSTIRKNSDMNDIKFITFDRPGGTGYLLESENYARYELRLYVEKKSK